MFNLFRHMSSALTLWCLSSAVSPGLDRVNMVVAKDGSGGFTTIQEALDAVPSNNNTWMIILIKKGTYNEKVFVTKNHVALVGEDRDSTRIVFAELRSRWTKSADNRPDGLSFEKDWGAAVVNIKDGVSDIVLANLTVHNNYGSLFGNHDHQFAVRAFRATRIAFLYCTLISDGGDTVSLWNSESGMYYHANCYFEGWVDYVCPRGWCYVTNSSFFGHNKTASLWHDGSANKNQKFVIRYSYFAGVPGFPLGRHHRDGQFYLLDCRFSRTMANQPIQYPDYSPNAKPWVWGARHYFYNCHGDSIDYPWFRDNLESAEHSPSPSDVTASWTFDNQWNPERDLPSVLVHASTPFPESNALGVPLRELTIRWVGGRNAITHKIHFGETTSPPVVDSCVGTMFKVEKLKPLTTYWWRIDEQTNEEIVEGPTWKFRTGE